MRQGLKSLRFPALFGTTEVVPFHETIYETSSRDEEQKQKQPQVLRLVPARRDSLRMKFDFFSQGGKRFIADQDDGLFFPAQDDPG
jgi:hypothetical protein